MSGEPPIARAALDQMISALGIRSTGEVDLPEGGSLPSAFAVSDLAQASVAAAGAALSELIGATGGSAPTVTVDRDLASRWFQFSIRPEGWRIGPEWDDLAGNYRATDGWIRLHTNAPRHRAAAVEVLAVPDNRDSVGSAVARWSADELEHEIVGAGGAAATMRSLDAWRAHDQGACVSGEPLVDVQRISGVTAAPTMVGVATDRPLAGVKVLDLTRVLAGPVATRLLAGFGASVLRVDPPGWDEPTIVPEVLLGKRTCRLDLSERSGRATFESLLASADVIVHGYRPDALEGLGYGPGARAAIRPGIIDVAIDAYGWSGPWSARRGFDSLIQMSAGIAHEGMAWAQADQPTPLPVQAIDHATGYLVAAAVLVGLTARAADGSGTRARLSLARTAKLLIDLPRPDGDEPPLRQPEISPTVEATSWGAARRIAPPLTVAGAPIRWEIPARAIGSDEPAF